MRRNAPLSVVVLLSAAGLLAGCQTTATGDAADQATGAVADTAKSFGLDKPANYVGSPFDGFGGFISDTITFTANPNQPSGDSTTVLRVKGQEPTAAPLTPQPGNVWPGPLPPMKTLADLEHEAQSPGFEVPDAGATKGTAPVPATNAVGPTEKAKPATTNPLVPIPTAPAQPAKPVSRVFQTPSGPATAITNPNGVETYTMPDGKTGIVVPNGNGTSTLIAHDGKVVTVPNPR